MKKTKKIISLLLSVLMIITALPLTAVESFAADEITSGVTGDCTWSLDGTVLTISGNGKMEDYDYFEKKPWGTLITKAIIENGVTSIGESAFNDCTSLTSITILDGVTSIGDKAFYKCTSLTNITIPNSVTNIGALAFGGCTSLTSVIIPDSVTSIGNDTFWNCTSLASITIPDSVTSIGNNAFVYTAYFNDKSNWDNGMLYIGNHLINAKRDISGSVEIKQGTKTIADSAFSDCKSLTNITIPDSVKCIGSWVFNDCKTLTSVKIGNGVTSIGRYAFYNCTSLTNIIIPDSVTSIGDYAFRGCISLARITIPDSVTEISQGDFYNCTSLESVTIGDGVKSIGNQTFWNCRSLTSVTIGNGVKSIGDGTFSGCSSLKSIIIPDSVTSIGSAFYGCTSLKSVTIPDSVTSIGKNAFYSCTSLESVTIGSGVTSIGSSAFYGCTSLASITIPDSVTSIGYEAFKGCASLKSITIESGVTSIDDYAFSGCTSLASMTIPNSVTSIGDDAFSGCTSLTSVKIGNGVTSIGGYAFEGCTSLASMTIPNSVTSIGYRAFLNCTSLTSIIIPDSVTSIGDIAFYNTAYYNDKSNWDNGILYIGNHLIKATLSESVEIKQGTKTIADSALGGDSTSSITIPDSVISIGDEAFTYCINLAEINVGIENANYSSENGILFNKDKTEIVCYPAGKRDVSSYSIPDSVTIIGDGAFKFTSLTSITIPDGVTSIGRYAFEDCRPLTSITIPDSVTNIGSSAFRNCTSLESVTIGDGVTSIEDETFWNCQSLASVTIGSSVTSIGDEAFFNCTSLTSIIIPDSVTSIGNSAFLDCTSLAIITIPNSVTEISIFAFNGCTSLKSVTIGSGVTSIGNLAFSGCTSLASITIPDSVTSIGYDAFSGCTSLTSVKIGDSVTSIGNSAFSGCTSLASITIPDSVTYIGYNAFGNCTSLESVTIPDSVTYIDEEAFGYYISNNGERKKINGFTIYGISGTTAEQYAKNNSFNFVDIREPESITVSKSPAKTTYFIGDTLDTTGLELILTYNNGDTETVTSGFSTSGFDSSTAGIKTVTVDYKGKTATFNVEVVKPRITIANNSLSFDSIGSTKSITVTTTPSDSEIVWKSSNESVATVENGVVTAKGAGNATITATITVNGIEYSAECTVDVKLPTMSFPDVRSGDWYYDAVKFNFERGYITGYSNGTFGPANNIQRQDFALILARIAGADLSAYEGQNGGFSDVPTNTYYSAAVAWAKDRGIVTGYSADNFGVGTYITREQISLILCRYLGGEASGDVDTILNAYPDGGNTSAWAKVGVAWAVENGIVGNAGYINPTGNAGRAEVAQIIYNMSNKGMI